MTDTPSAESRAQTKPFAQFLREMRKGLLHEELSEALAQVRYRVRDGKLAIGYELVRPDEVEDTVMQRIADELRTDIDRVYTGSPA